MTPYKVVFADPRVEKDFAKALKKLPKNDQQTVYDQLKSLASNPHPHGNRIKTLVSYSLYGHPATHRLRVGRYRVLYDIDEVSRRVVLLAIRKRDERTYQ